MDVHSNTTFRQLVGLSLDQLNKSIQRNARYKWGSKGPMREEIGVSDHTGETGSYSEHPHT